MAELSVSLAGVRLRNPIIAAAGTCGYVDELADVLDLSRIGAVTSKSITVEPREGNPAWRIVDLPRAPGMLNAIGLANVGLDAFVRDKLPAAAGLGCVLIGSIAGGSASEYVTVARAFDQAANMPLVELNVSCPNTDDGRQFGDDPGQLASLIRAVRPVLSHKKMIVKLSPGVTDITAMARAAIDAGADALTLINTMPAMSIDVKTRHTRLSRGSGGISGPAIHPIAVRMVHEVHRAVAKDAGIPIIGLGGVMHWEDAAELILAGATGVGMGTALFVDPRLMLRVAAGLERWVADQGCASVSELVGRATTP